jgi:hypothetical protein
MAIITACRQLSVRGAALGCMAIGASFGLRGAVLVVAAGAVRVTLWCTSFLWLVAAAALGAHAAGVGLVTTLAGRMRAGERSVRLLVATLAAAL